jgi:MraZ protein
MTQFLGTFLGKRDGKGRLSIPAPFRSALRGDGEGAGLILRPSHKYDCIEGWAAADFAQLSGAMQGLDLFSDDGDDMAHLIFGEAMACEPDRDGRIVLPEAMASKARLGESVAFVGLNLRFEIWDPQGLQAHRDAALARVAARKISLPARPA